MVKQLTHLVNPVSVGVKCTLEAGPDGSLADGYPHLFGQDVLGVADDRDSRPAPIGSRLLQKKPSLQIDTVRKAVDKQFPF
jgi:hypothetical protein